MDFDKVDQILLKKTLEWLVSVWRSIEQTSVARLYYNFPCFLGQVPTDSIMPFPLTTNPEGNSIKDDRQKNDCRFIYFFLFAQNALILPLLNTGITSSALGCYFMLQYILAKLSPSN